MHIGTRAHDSRERTGGRTVLCDSVDQYLLTGALPINKPTTGVSLTNECYFNNIAVSNGSIEVDECGPDAQASDISFGG